MDLNFFFQTDMSKNSGFHPLYCFTKIQQFI
jgi:hypothetical protein